MSSRTVIPALVLLAIAAPPATALNRGNAGPEKVEIRFPLPPPAPLSPEAALAAFRLEPGCRIELVAAEPLIEAPVAMSWDDAGRLYVVEMRGYMQDLDGKRDLEPIGRIRRLEDTDGDGRMDRADDFLTGLVLPRAVMAVNGGVLVAEPPRLLFCKDTDGDGRADVREEIAADFGSRTGQPEHMANSTLWAMDNSVWAANCGTRWRFRAGSWTRDAGLGRGQYGLCQDDTGRLFFNYNSDLLRCDLLPADAMTRHPLLRPTAAINVKVVTDQTVWPAHPTPGVNRGYEAKTLRDDGSLRNATAACGALIYRGDALPAWRGHAFIPEPSGNLVKRVVLTESEGRPVGTHSHPDRDFLVSTDERFRPVVAADGPDGALYIVDMHRGIIQHSGFLTHYLKANIEARRLAAPLDRGRIWRILPAEGARPQPVGIPADPAGRAALLAHPNGWVRDTAQRLLVESASPAAVAAVVPILTHPDPLARLHALWTMDGMAALNADHVRPRLADKDARIRAAAVRIAGREMAADLEALAGDPDPAVRGQLALRLSTFGTPEADTALARLLSTPAPAFVIEAALTGLRGRETAFTRRLLSAAPHKIAAPFLEAAASLAMAAGKAGPTAELLALAADHPDSAAAILKGMGAGQEKSTRVVWLEREPDSVARLRSVGALRRPLASLEPRLAWPGKPGAPPPPPPVPPLDAAQQERFEKGRAIYTTLCAACHQAHGFGLDGLAPPIVDSEWVLGRPDVTARIILHGLAGPIKVGGRTWELAMPPLPQLTDDDIAATLTYIRRSWEHTAAPVSPAEVAAVRARWKDRTTAWTAAELKNAR